MLSPTDVPTFILTDAAGCPVFEQAAPIGYVTVLPGGTPPPVSEVPEPEPWLLAGTGLVGLLVCRHDA